MDPFLGSGQVAVVSKMKGRHYIGFEIVPAYYEFACKRVESGKYLIHKTEAEWVSFENNGLDDTTDIFGMELNQQS